MTGMLDAVRAAPRDVTRTATDFSTGDPTPLPRRSVWTRDGRTVAYADMRGGGPDVVLIHGTLMTLEDMCLGPAVALAQSDFCVVAVDPPSTTNPSPTSLDPMPQPISGQVSQSKRPDEPLSCVR